jgi:hypothetical protein
VISISERYEIRSRLSSGTAILRRFLVRALGPETNLRGPDWQQRHVVAAGNSVADEILPEESWRTFQRQWTRPAMIYGAVRERRPPVLSIIGPHHS